MKDYDTYLRNLYGDYMQLPPKDEQINRHATEDVTLVELGIYGGKKYGSSCIPRV